MGLKYDDPPDTNEDEAAATSVTTDEECTWLNSAPTSFEDHQDEVFRED